jgi:RHH-type proline utilization regulon transcriptional repressor/proline dehydrogenase/delta 1-pyrroline-5-carboxylate dehydrogenase
LFEARSAEIISLCQREAGKTLTDSVLELREAVDFLRYYACEARMLFSSPSRSPAPPASRTCCASTAAGVRHDQPVELPAGDLHRHGFRCARRGQHA